jgi:hypothetical protein
MKAARMLLLGFVSLMVSLMTYAQSPEPIIKSQSVEQKRECVKAYFDSQMHVKEATNSNDGVEINAYFNNIGLHLDKAKASHRRWCAAFIANGYKQCGVKCPTRSWANLAAVKTWNSLTKYHIDKRDADVGDSVSYSFQHQEGVYERHPNPSFPYFTACGGNTSAPRGSGSTKEGVWKKPRLWRDVNKVTSLARLG